MTKQGYIRQQILLQQRLMKKYATPVYRALQKQISEAVAMIEAHGIEATYNLLSGRMAINHDIATVIRSLYLDSARLAEPKTVVSKSLIIPIFGFIRDVINYFNQYLLEKVVLPISRTTQNDILKVLKMAISEGWGVDKTVRTLKAPDVPKWRSQMIVRTESVRAMNYSQLKAADNKKFEVEKQWIAIEDKRTRVAHTHAGVDGERRDLYDSYSNGLLFPGDPEGPAEQVINCRCTQGYFLKRDLDNNLIPKKNPAELSVSV